MVLGAWPQRLDPGQDRGPGLPAGHSRRRRGRGRHPLARRLVAAAAGRDQDVSRPAPRHGTASISQPRLGRSLALPTRSLPNPEP